MQLIKYGGSVDFQGKLNIKLDTYLLLKNINVGTYLGQNFLIDNKIRHFIGDKIQEEYNKLGCEALIEIGPGKGSITKLIKDISANFFVIEKDNTLVKDGKLTVEGLEDVRVILSDVLEVNVEEELEKRGCKPQKTLVVGNLPYYITSPILRKFFGEGKQDYAGGIFMVQKEVADKTKFDADKKSYLRRLLNYAYDVHYIKTVPAKSFKPAPKVTSAVIWIASRILTPNLSPSERGNMGFEDLLEFLEDFAPFSRKTLGAIATMIKKKKGKEWIIPENLKGKRLEELGWGDIENIK